jgi:hypothetical protein
MFQCPFCSNTETFRVTETVRQITTIRCLGPDTYDVVRHDAIDPQAWEAMTCTQCRTVHAEWDLRDTYAGVHPQDAAS